MRGSVNINKFFAGIVLPDDDENLTMKDKVVFWALCTFADWEYKNKKPNVANSVFPSFKAIAQRASCSIATVTRALKRLEEFGYIARQKRKKSNVYSLINAFDTIKKGTVRPMNTNMRRESISKNNMLRESMTSTSGTPPLNHTEQNECSQRAYNNTTVTKLLNNNNNSENFNLKEKEKEIKPEETPKVKCVSPEIKKAAALALLDNKITTEEYYNIVEEKN